MFLLTLLCIVKFKNFYFTIRMVSFIIIIVNNIQKKFTIAAAPCG